MTHYTECHYDELYYAYYQYTECPLCCVTISPVCWESLCWVALCCESLCWVSLCWPLCWMSLCWVPLCIMSLCWASLCILLLHCVPLRCVTISLFCWVSSCWVSLCHYCAHHALLLITSVKSFTEPGQKCLNVFCWWKPYVCWSALVLHKCFHCSSLGSCYKCGFQFSFQGQHYKTFYGCNWFGVMTVVIYLLRP